MQTMTVMTNAGSLLFKALIDDEGNVEKADGPFSAAVTDLIKDFGPLEAAALASKYERSSVVTMEDGDGMKITESKPKLGGGPDDIARPRRKAVEKQEPPQKGIVVVAVPSNQAGIAVDGGLPPSEVHATIGFIGKVGEIEDEEGVIERLKWFVKRHTTSFTAKVGGISMMGEDDPQATCLLIEATELQHIRDMLEMAVPLDKLHPHYTPHVTLGYGVAAPGPKDRPESIHFSHIELWYGGEHFKAGDDTKVLKEEEVEFGEVSTIAKIDPDKQLVFGWAYVSHDRAGNVVVDKSGEFVDDVEELESTAYNFVVKSRVGGDGHAKNDDGTPRQVGTMVESMVFTPEKIAKMGIPEGVLPTGWWVGFRVEDDQAWQDVKSGKRRSFSIMGKALRKEVT